MNPRKSTFSFIKRMFSCLAFAGTITVATAQDTTPPIVLSAITQNSSMEVVVNYSEPMDLPSASDLFNYVINSSSGFPVVLNAQQDDTAGMSFRLFLDIPVPPFSTLSISMVTDAAFNVIDPNPTEIAILPDGPDITRPTAVSAILDGVLNQEILVTYSEPMDASYATDLFLYGVDTTSGPVTVDNVSIVDATLQKFLVTLHSPVSPGATITIFSVQDISGNVIDPDPTVLSIQPAGGDTTPPTVTCNVTTSLLTPPNKAMRNVGLSIFASDDVTASPSVSFEVYSDEVLSVNDVHYTNGILYLRAERSLVGNGRVYLIIATAEDEAGNIASACATVAVPYANAPWAITAVQNQAAAAAVDCTIPQANCAPNGIAAWWPLDSNASDIIGGNDLTFLGNPFFVPGVHSGAMQLDGPDDSASAPASPLLDIGTGAGVTIEGWVNPVSSAYQQPIIEWAESTVNTGLHLWLSVNTLVGDGTQNLFANLIDSTGTAHHFFSAPGLMQSGTWQHVALTYNKASGDAYLYYNGTSVAHTNFGSLTLQTSYPVYLGLRPGWDGSSAYRLTGALDEIALYNRALPAQAIQRLYNVGKCRSND